MLGPADLFYPKRGPSFGVDGMHYRLVGLGVKNSIVQHQVLQPRAAGVHFHLREPGAGQTMPGGKALGNDFAARRLGPRHARLPSGQNGNQRK